MRSGGVIGGLGLAVVLVMGCPGDDDSGEAGGSTVANTSAGTTASTTPSSASNEDGPEPVTCEQLGGTCNCVGSCEPGTAPSTEGVCPQPPDESGACSSECCLPMGPGTSSSGADTGSSGTTAAGSSTGGG